MVKRKKILIIEDNPIILELLTTLLKKEGFEVIISTNGKIALGIIKKHPTNYIDLIITDMQMPVLSGLEFANTIKSNPKYKKIPIILITQYENSIDSNIKLFQKIIHKSHIPDKLSLEVKKILNK